MNGITVRAYSKAKDGETRPFMSNGKRCTNFKVREFACTDGSDTVFIAPALVTLLQQIRDHFGQPITVNSGYRTPAKNKAVGGAAYSQHLYGTAADITVKNVAPRDVAAFASQLLPHTGGIGIYATFTHVDIRAAKSRWNG